METQKSNAGVTVGGKPKAAASSHFACFSCVWVDGTEGKKSSFSGCRKERGHRPRRSANERACGAVPGPLCGHATLFRSVLAI
ncbi:hypothetical protein GN956_G9127 [Arapaima gigas]